MTDLLETVIAAFYGNDNKIFCTVHHVKSSFCFNLSEICKKFPISTLGWMFKIFILEIVERDISLFFGGSRIES